MTPSYGIHMEGIEYQPPTRQITIVIAFRYPAIIAFDGKPITDEVKKVYRTILELFNWDCDAPQGSVTKNCWDNLRGREEEIKRMFRANAISQLLHMKDKLEAIQRAHADTVFLFSDLFPNEVFMKILGFVAARGRLIELEHQYPVDFLPHLNFPCLRTTPADDNLPANHAPHEDHAHNPVHHHPYFRPTRESLKKLPFQDLCKRSRMFVEKNYTPVCLDNLDPQSPAFRAKPREIQYNPNTDTILFGAKACKNTIQYFCHLTHRLEINVAKIAYDSNYGQACCHWSAEFDAEHTDVAPWDNEFTEVIQLLHGIAPEDLDTTTSLTFPGCRGLKALYHLGTSDIFQQVAPGMVNSDTFLRENYDTNHQDFDWDGFKFLKRQKLRLAEGRQLEGLKNTTPRWTQNNFEIGFMQLAHREPDFPIGWHYRVHQFLPETILRVVTNGDLKYLKIIAINRGCSIQVQSRVGKRGLGPIVEVGIIGPNVRSTEAVVRDILEFDEDMAAELEFIDKHGDNLTTGRKIAPRIYPALEPNKTMCACNTVLNHAGTCADCRFITAYLAPAPLPPLYTEARKDEIRSKCEQGMP